MTQRDKYLTRLVENALGIQVNDSLDTEGYGDTNVNRKREKQGLPPEQGPQYSEVANEEMVEKEPLPKYENIEKLMQEIEHGTNKASHEYKMNRMKEVAEMLEAKVGSLEEGEHAEHIDQKAVKQMRKDIAALRKAEEKLRKEFDRKFNKKGKATPAPKAETETEKPTLQETAMEKQFDLRKFLTENKMTTNSRIIKENEFEDDEMFQSPDVQLSDDARTEIEGAIESYPPKDVAVTSDHMGEMITQALEELDGYEVPEGMFNNNMHNALLRLSTRFHSGKIDLDHAVEEAVTIAMDPKNYN